MLRLYSNNHQSFVACLATEKQILTVPEFATMLVLSMQPNCAPWSTHMMFQRVFDDGTHNLRKLCELGLQLEMTVLG